MNNDKGNNLDISNSDAQNYNCPTCSGPLKFIPEKSILYCEYCGNEIKLDGIINNNENDYFEGKKEDNTWVEETKVIHCNNCGSNNVVDSSCISLTCPFCGSNQVVETAELSGIKPHRIIPFKISDVATKENYIKWLKGKVFVPRKLKKQIPSLVINGVYVPIWTFDSDTNSLYKGVLGKNYTRTVGSGKNAHTVTETRYFDISGQKIVKFDDLIVNAGSKIDQKEINALSPFYTNKSFEYDKRYLIGFSAEHYEIRLSDGWDLAKKRMSKTIERVILSDYDYDVVSDLKVKTSYYNIKYKYVLIPIWIGLYKYGNKNYYFLTNGETGKFKGKAPLSAFKISLLVIIILIAVIGLILFIYFYN